MVRLKKEYYTCPPLHTHILCEKGAFFLKKLFQTDPIMEIINCRQFRMIGDYKFLEASEQQCSFIYEKFFILIKAKRVHIDVLKEEELIIHVEELTSIEMKRQVDDYE